MDNIVEKPHMQMDMEVDEDGISVPNWLLEVIAFITRMEMANPPSMATSCRLFKQLCWPKLHGDVEPHRVADLDYSKYLYRGYNREIFPYPQMQKKIKIDSQEVIPVACSPPPDYIIGFGNIRICFLDDQIIEFMQNIAPLLVNCNLSYNTNTRRWTNDEEKTVQMRRLLETMSGKIYQFNSSDVLFFDCQLFPGVIDQVEYGIFIRQYKMHSEVLFNWLINNNGRQKILHLNNGGQTKYLISAFINRIKKQFSNATNAVKFVIYLIACFREFRMENEQTGEILELRRNYRHTPYEYRRREGILVRYAAGQNWNNVGEEEMNGRSSVTKINLEILDI